MKTLNPLLILLLILLGNSVVFAQEFTVPQNYSFESKDDFAKYEKDVIACVNWPENTPLKQGSKKRVEANAFFIQWLTGAPNVSISINPNVLTFTKKNKDLLVIFMGGWTKFVLENPEFNKDMVKGNVEGIKSAIRFYQKNLGDGIKKDKNMRKLISLDEEGTLESWVKEQLE